MSKDDGEDTNQITTPPQQNTPAYPALSVDDMPWVDYAVQQAQIAQKTFDTTLENTIQATRSRLDRILTTSSAHLNQTIDSFQEVTAGYSVYEDIFVGKVKENFLVAASHPFITAGTVFGVGILALKKTRQFMYYKSMSLIYSEETLLSRADAKVKALRQSVDLLKAESEKLEKNALQAEENLVRGRTKLRHAGKQIQSVISSAYKIERQAAGLKDVLKELPSREASKFRTQVANLGKEAKQERNALSKEVSKISNYGISV